MTEIFSGFYKRTPEERLAIVQEAGFVGQSEVPSLPKDIANQMIENFVGSYQLPMGLAVNVQVNGQAYAVPMAIEEPSVIAAVANGGKILGNIDSKAYNRELIGQIIIQDLANLQEAKQMLEAQTDKLLHKAAEVSQSMIQRGGGPRKIWVEVVEDFLTLYLSLDSCDSMGANLMNTILEHLVPSVETLTQGKVLMGILSNYSTEANVTAKVKVPLTRLSAEADEALQMAERIAAASSYAQLDPYRAATHNKGIMNGIDAVLIATGNDWRAVEAGVHAYAVQAGQYRGLSRWWLNDDQTALHGELSLPLYLATVGGSLSNHPTAQWALDLLGRPSGDGLSEIIAAVGLIQNFSAVRALVTTGIQKGHMRMQARSLAMQAGARTDNVSEVVEALMQAPLMNLSAANDIVRKVQGED
ncbi:hydroxymethylglutaryl-CoA reductase, degradative [Suicoccus acidiformans]|uniref:3-hydroxy-3-methylglutaryl coenzyme A reductase n=1 Tax=Suicoccus acidiformans TaxID=2036206 RepID=A0A347WLM7_9LACT|nr:hydroxymethylglutaryl-CoA reductase, degradative [Suicoccus acidiformans]AXY25984.1 hydroxymethylglutaryl-CoA reductase, degradative [Suicoccus acidiformans]